SGRGGQPLAIQAAGVFEPAVFLCAIALRDQPVGRLAIGRPGGVSTSQPAQPSLQHPLPRIGAAPHLRFAGGLSLGLNCSTPCLASVFASRAPCTIFTSVSRS